MIILFSLKLYMVIPLTLIYPKNDKDVFENNILIYLSIDLSNVIFSAVFLP